MFHTICQQLLCVYVAFIELFLKYIRTNMKFGVRSKAFFTYAFLNFQEVLQDLNLDSLQCVFRTLNQKYCNILNL